MKKSGTKKSFVKKDARQMKNFFTVVIIITLVLFLLIYILFQST